MTVALDIFQHSFDQAQDANVQAANMAGAMAAMGRYAQEFTIYGTAFWQEGRRHYLVSSEADKLYDFLHRDEQLSCLAAPVVSQTTSLVVPSGCAEEVGRTVRRTLARELSEIYPAAFFAVAEQLTAFTPNTSAEALLGALQAELEGRFDGEQVDIFAGLLQFAYTRGNVTALFHQQLQTWVARQRREMAGDAVPKERCSQTFYGFAYQMPEGSWVCYANAVKNAAYQRLSLMQAKGCLTSPLITKNCGYQQGCPLREVRADFLVHLQTLFDAAYQKRLMTLAALPPALEQAAFEETLAEVQRKFTEPCLWALKAWGRRWGMRV